MRLINDAIALIRKLETHPAVGTEKWLRVYAHAQNRLARRRARHEQSDT